MRKLRFWIGDLYIRLGLWIMPVPEFLQAAKGDHLTHWGYAFGVEREFDEEYRQRILDVITNIDEPTQARARRWRP